MNIINEPTNEDEIMENFNSFKKMYEKFEEIDTLPTSNVYQKQLNDMIHLLQMIEDNIEKNCIYSNNEINIDDLNNNQIELLQIDFYLAILCNKIISNEKENKLINRHEFRMKQINTVEYYFSIFLDKIGQIYNIIPINEIKDHEERLKDKNMSAHDTRQLKIERFQNEKKVKQAMKDLEQTECKIKWKDGHSYDDGIEEITREKLLLLLRLYCWKTFEEQISLKTEREMLKKINKMFCEKDKDAQIEDLFDEKRQPVPQGKGISLTHINKNFEIRRELFKAQVFQPGHNLPTMSLDEFATIQVQDAKERQRKEKETPVGPRKYDQLLEAGEEDNINLVDEATYKDRSWDDWKDNNPRGIGNKKGSRF